MLLRSISCLVVALAAVSARADIYQSVSEDGGVTLSNLPGSAREVLVAEERPVDATAARRPDAVPVSAAPVVTRPAPVDGASARRPNSVPQAPSAVVPSAADADRFAPPPGAPSTPVVRPPSVAVAMHFAPGAPGAPAWSEAVPPQSDGKAAEPGWLAPTNRASTPGRTMPVSASELPAWASASPAATGAAGPASESEAAEYRVATDDIVSAVALKHELDPALLHAVVTVESAYNSRAVSPRGARGLMQVLPETGRRYGVRDLFDPVQNLTAGASYLRDLLHLFKQDVALALAAYNAGENAVIRHGNAIPPYPETQSYVPRVLATWRAYTKYFARKRT